MCKCRLPLESLRRTAQPPNRRTGAGLLWPPLQRARDELATALLAAERRAQEAEEEHLRAEAAAADLATQLQEAQRQAEAAAAASAGGGDAAAAAAARAGTPPRRRGRLGRGATESETAEAARDAEILLAELDKERLRR